MAEGNDQQRQTMGTPGIITLETEMNRMLVRQFLYRAYIPKNVSDVFVQFGNPKELDSLKLNKIPDTQLWEGKIDIPCDMRQIEYTLYFSEPKVLRGKKKMNHSKKYCNLDSKSLNWEFEIVSSKKEYSLGYVEHLRHIFNTARDDQMNDTLLQMRKTEIFLSEIVSAAKPKILEEIVKLIQEKLTQRAKYAAFVCCVSQLKIAYSTLKYKLTSSGIATDIFKQCFTLDRNPTIDKDAFFESLEKVYRCSDIEDINFLSFCNLMQRWPNFLHLCASVMSNWVDSTKPFPIQSKCNETAKVELKCFLGTVAEAAKHCDISKVMSFFENLQNCLSFDLQIEFLKELGSTNLISRNTSTEELKSAYMKSLTGFSKEGDTENIFQNWKKICPFISTGKISETTETYITESLNRVDKRQIKVSHAMLEEMCLADSLFLKANSQIKILKILSTSKDEYIHALVTVCLREKKFQEIPFDELKDIIQDWFQHAAEHFCGKVIQKDGLHCFLVKLYSYVGKIYSNSCFLSQIELKKTIDRKTFEILKDIDIFDMIDAIPKIQNFESEDMENVFKAHIRELFTCGLKSKDFTNTELFGRTKCCEMNSRTVFHFFQILMDCSALEEKMELEEAISTILRSHFLWVSIFKSKGPLSDELLNEKLAVKAKNTILKLQQDVETKSVNVKFFENIQKKNEYFSLFILVQEEHKNVEEIWEDISKEIQLTFKTVGGAIDVFQRAKYKVFLESSVKDCIEFCLKFLEDMNQTLLDGNICISEATGCIYNDSLLENIWKDCGSLLVVKESEVFWNMTSHFPFTSGGENVLNENKDNIYVGISVLFEENKTNRDNHTTESLINGSRYLRYLTEIVLEKYRSFWNSLLKGTDLQVSEVQKNFKNSNVIQELELAEKVCDCTAKKEAQQSLKSYGEFEQQREMINLMKQVLNAFKIDVMKDEDQKAMLEYAKLLDGDIGDMTLFQIGSSLALVGQVVNIIDHKTLPVLRELQRASILIEFLRTVVNEDIRNLIDAVEEHSEQFVRESTVSDLIDVKRFLQPILKEKHKNIREFFKTVNESLIESGIKNTEQKIHECSSNVHSLKALYNHVANRGEHTKEIIENIVKKGEFHFLLREKECDVIVEYNQDGKNQSYSTNYLNDLRSRALLILNTEEKQHQPLQRYPHKKKHLTTFIEKIDLALDIGYVCVLLRQSGHFQFVQFDQKHKKETLSELLYELKRKYDEWCKVLFECRKRFYLMNYIQSDQLQVLYNFIKTGCSKESVITLLQFINPALSDFEIVLSSFEQSKDYDSPEQNLEILGKTLDSISNSLLPTAETMFDKDPNSKSFEIVQAGRIFVAALDSDSHLVIRTLLGLHWHTTQKMPFAHNILLCNRNTTKDEITLLLNRCLGCKSDQLFSIANIDMLCQETQDFLDNNLMSFPKNSTFKLSLLCRGKHHPIFEKFGDSIAKPKPLTENELQELFSRKYPHVLTVTSVVPGLGKSEEIHRRALQNEMGRVCLHISGIFDKDALVEELLRLEIKHFHILHIDIGPVNKPEELDAFLFELIVLKHVSARKLAFHLQTDHVCVEIANSINRELCDSLPTVTSFRKQHIKWENYENMIVSQEVSSPIQVVCNYLHLQDKGYLNQTDLFFTGTKKVCPLSTNDCRKLLQKHFSSSSDLSFSIMNIFLGVLADQLKKMSSSIFFRSSNIQLQHKSIKSELINALKRMSFEFSLRSINACKSAQVLSMGGRELSNPSNTDACLTSEECLNRRPERMTAAEVSAKRTEGMIKWEESNHLMVLFHYDLQTVSAFYREKDNIPEQISNLFESQLKRKLEDYESKSQDELTTILLKLVQPPGMNICELTEVSKHYALTPDNLLKMVLIVLRIQGHQPIIIMGETGCGKTSLIRFLSIVCKVDFQIMSIHAGITEEAIVKKLSDCDGRAKQNFKKCVWLFLDEINTCDHLGLISDILCHHLCKGKRLSPNLKILAACNPYRLRLTSGSTEGLQGKIKADQLSKLVYRVHPLPEAMIDYVWDYGSLQKKDEKAYIERMVQGLFENTEIVQLFTKLLIMSQKFVKKKESTDCCVSLRDVERCRRLVDWFIDMLKKKGKPDSYCLNQLETNAIILALSICYYCRFPDNSVRESYRKKIAKCCGQFEFSKCFICDDKTIKNIIVEQQNDILDRMELPPGIAKNTALRENVFVILVCILNKIPVFVVGKPGCSKSLSMQLIRSNLRGKDSSDEFFKSLPQLYCVSFQGSESSTSDGIIKVFEKAKNYQSYNQSEDVLSVVLLDEIGLAEISRFNPLKVLHSLLEPENMAKLDVAVVGISNWALDAAKMNRAIYLSRSGMDEKELYETALSIVESILNQPFSSWSSEANSQAREEVEQLLQKLSKAYSVYSENQMYGNFHGLRDFYSLTKYIGKGILVDKQFKKINEIVVHGLLRNLGGLPKELSESMFKEFQHCLQTDHLTTIDVLNLIQDNLQDKQSRHLMLITNGDAVLSVLEDKIKEMERQHVVIFGSRFEDDLTDEYNYRILSRIILCMEQGYILILKDLENIYGSLYDMLNQNYTTVGSKKNCRVALGPYSNPMCHVHEDFKCIVLVEESKLDFSDPPFLNRFEKQQFRFEDIMDKNDNDIKNEVMLFTKKFCEVHGHSYKPESVFALSGENIISSLVLQMQKEEKERELILKKCQNQLLWITTPEAIVRIRDTVLGKEKPNLVKQIEKLYYTLPIHNGLFSLLNVFNGNKHLESTELLNTASLLVIFTYDPQDQFMDKQLRNFKNEKLRNFKSEKHLKHTIKDFFESDSPQMILHCSVKENLEHILLAKSTIESYHKKMSKPKNVCIICHLNRQGDTQERLTQINFLSGWKLAMLDTLHDPVTPLPELIHLSVVEILEKRRPMTNVVQNLIFRAFATIQYVGTGYTADKMIKTVRSVMESDECLSILEKLVFTTINEEKGAHENWRKNVAYNEHAILRESCFMNALEHYLLNTIKNPLSKIIFKLEEANAFESALINDHNHESRITLWKQLIVKSSLLDISNIPDPFGPECYTCSSGRYSMKLPFSYVILSRVDKIKDDFLRTLMQVKTMCNLDEEDEDDEDEEENEENENNDVENCEDDEDDECELDFEKNDVSDIILAKLTENYSEIIEQNLTEFLDVDYSEKFSEYKHDFYLMMYSNKTGILHDDERVEVLELAQNLFDTEESCHNFALHVTRVHVLHWTYGNVLDSIFEIVNIVKKYTDISSEWLFNFEDVTDDSNTQIYKRELIVDRLCRLFLPTTKLLARFPSVREWQYQVSRALPCFAEISLKPPTIHMLRFCNDVANAMFCSTKDAVKNTLTTLGDELEKGTHLESKEMFQLVTEQLKIAKENEMVDFENYQLLIYQYLLRSITNKQKQNSTLICLLESKTEEAMLDRDLEFFGPILEKVIGIEIKAEFLINLKKETESRYLQCINNCLRKSDERANSVLPSILVAILQEKYHDKVCPEKLDCIQGASDRICKLAFVALRVLHEQDECYINLIASIAYLRSIIHAYVALLGRKTTPKSIEESRNKGKFSTITNTIKALLNSGAEKHLPIDRVDHYLQVFFLKCMFSCFELNELKQFLHDWKNCLAPLKSIDLKDDILSRSLTFHPLSLYIGSEDENLEGEYLRIEQLESTRQKEILEAALCNSQNSFNLCGCIASKFFLKCQQEEMNDTCKTTAKLIFEMFRKRFSAKRLRVAELMLKITDFNHRFLHIDTETKTPDIQIVSVLTHLLQLVIFGSDTGNFWYDILTNVSNIKSRYLPGNAVEEFQTITVSNLSFCDNCKLRFSCTEQACPKCSKRCEPDMSFQNEKIKCRKKGYEKPFAKCICCGILSPVTHHLLQLIINGCILLSVAAKFEDDHTVKTLLGMDNDPNVELTEILLMKWKYLKCLTQLNNEDLCAFVHIVIHDLKIIFTSKETPYHCKTEKDCENVEKRFQSCIEKFLEEKYNVISKARLAHYRKRGMDINCQIYELCERPEDLGSLFPILFRMTSPATKGGLVAQVFHDSDLKKFPFLKLVLMREDILKLPKFILPMLRWHQCTVSLGSYKMKKVDCNDETIEKFFRMENDDKRRYNLKKRFNEFKSSWNELVMNQRHLLDIKLNEEDVISNKSKVMNCIITDKHSLIQKVLIELVKIHNHFIDDCLHLSSTFNVPSLRFLMTGEHLSEVKSISLWELSSKDIIEFGSSIWNQELIQHSQCKSKFGEGQDRYYNLHKIENELSHCLVLGKPYISVPETIPRILFVDELFQNTIQLLENVRKNIHQEKLPKIILESIVKKMEKDSSEIPELMTVLGMSLSLLKRTKGDPNMPLTKYLEDWKWAAVFPKDYDRLFPEPNDEVKLCHVVNLYVKLEEMNGETIHGTLDLKYYKDLPTESKEKLETAMLNYPGHLEVLAESLKIFIHRCLSLQNNAVSVDQMLIEYLKDETFWPYGNMERSELTVDGKSVKLSEILCSTLCVKHIYKTVVKVTDFIKEEQDKDNRAHEVAEAVRASGNFNNRKPKKKRQNIHFGKT